MRHEPTDGSLQAFPRDGVAGLTIRECLAAMALQGIVNDYYVAETAADTAVALADALINALNK